jgi:hypothetical protein
MQSNSLKNKHWLINDKGSDRFSRSPSLSLRSNGDGFRLCGDFSLRIGKFDAEIKYATSLGLEVVRNFISGLPCVHWNADVKVRRPTVGAVAKILEFMSSVWRSTDQDPADWDFFIPLNRNIKSSVVSPDVNEIQTGWNTLFWSETPAMKLNPKPSTSTGFKT